MVEVFPKGGNPAVVDLDRQLVVLVLEQLDQQGPFLLRQDRLIVHGHLLGWRRAGQFSSPDAFYGRLWIGHPPRGKSALPRPEAAR